MVRKMVTVLLLVLLAQLCSICPSIAAGKTRNDLNGPEKIKAQIVKIGTGDQARVDVKLKDGTKVRGNVERIDADGFVLKNFIEGSSTSITFASVKKVEENRKSGRSLGKAVAIGAGIGAGIFATLFIIYAAAEH
jgi:hypothetical protein